MKYDKLYKYIGAMASGTVLDIGCGKARLKDFVEDYHGFDLNPETPIWKGDAYYKSNYGDYDTYVSTEVLEHLDDFRVLENIPAGKRFIFSVPNFYDEGHQRVYTEKIIRERFKDILDIHSIVRFDCVFKDKKPFDVYILLVNSTKKAV